MGWLSWLPFFDAFDAPDGKGGGGSGKAPERDDSDDRNECCWKCKHLDKDTHPYRVYCKYYDKELPYSNDEKVLKKKMYCKGLGERYNFEPK